jgi:hypothetical protein
VVDPTAASPVKVSTPPGRQGGDKLVKLKALRMTGTGNHAAKGQTDVG